jgi:hypothetical protein
MKHLFIALSIFLVACGGAEKLDETHASATVTDPVLNTYFQLKDALVRSDMPAAVKHAQTLAETSIDNEIGNYAVLIFAAPDINAQRDHFEELSNAIIAYSKSLELSQNVFVQFCPMALDGKGAQWLATEEPILNPYYGKMMLRCGALKETIN